MTAEKQENCIMLTVMDNGVGMDEDALNRLYTLLDSDQPGHKENYEWASIGLKMSMTGCATFTAVTTALRCTAHPAWERL